MADRDPAYGRPLLLVDYASSALSSGQEGRVASNHRMAHGLWRGETVRGSRHGDKRTTQGGDLLLEALEVIRGRKSTRAFLPDPVPRELIGRVLNAARWAPSGNNRQRWRVTVAAGTKCQTLASLLAQRARERASRASASANPSGEESPGVSSLRVDLTRIARSLGQSYGEFVGVGSNSLYGAPVAVVVSDPGKRGGDTPQFVTTMLLAAHALGLATCWLGYPLVDSDLIRQVLEIPEEERITAVIALGYPDPDSPASAYRSPRDELDSFVRWTGFD